MQLHGKNILILTISGDRTTNKVLKFLTKTKFLRVNDTDQADVSINDMGNIEIKINDNKFIDEINIGKIWYRIGNVFRTHDYQNHLIKPIVIKEEIHFNDFIYYYLERRFEVLGSITSEFTLNKLIVLFQAKARGLTIPFSNISNSKNIEITQPDFFVKSITNFTPFEFNGFRYGPIYSMLPCSTYTFNSISFYQNYIDKIFEVRTFYLYGEFYSMAIFSQNNPNTKMDYRNSDGSKPNRNVPIKLPTDLENKLNALMTDLNLNSGSIDLIYSKSKEFIFLEVNPSGQIDWLSTDCNYYIEKKIARYLDET